MECNHFINNTLSELEEANHSPIYGYQDLPILTLEEAIQKITPLVPRIMDYVATAKKKCNRNSKLLTWDESAAIYLYSMPTFFFSRLNETLRAEDRHALKPWFAFLKLFITALEKLPSIKKTVWRGISGDVSSIFTDGDVHIWWSVNSCSMDLKVIERHLSETSIVFAIDTIYGRDISMFSAFVEEQEVVLMPGTRVRAKCESLNFMDRFFLVSLEEVSSEHYTQRNYNSTKSNILLTNALPNNEPKKTGDNDNHLELFSLIWLDINVHDEKNKDAEQELRSVINHVKKFQDGEECQQYIQERSKQDRLVLVVSDQLGREVVPAIHNLQQVSSIYVFCHGEQSNEQWACNFAKVKVVLGELDELVSQIKTDHKIRMKREEPLFMNIFVTGRSTTEINDQYVYSQILMDCILRLKSTETDKNELVSCCEKEYEGNNSELTRICEFRDKYSSDKALRWYTRESFFCKTLNAALRKQDVHMIFLYRSCISDIRHQLKRYQSNYPLQVYRSQLMQTDELKVLRQSIRQFISMNSFTSTTKERSMALFRLGNETAPIGFERVLFEIDADPEVVTTKPFADISIQSDFPVESEVLFMLGSIFRLNSIRYCEGEKLWIIQMTLCRDDEHDLECVIECMKRRNVNGNVNLKTLGRLLWNMGELNLAEKYYTRFLRELPQNDPQRRNLYKDLTEITLQNRDFDASNKWSRRWSDFKKRKLAASEHCIDKRSNPNEASEAMINTYNLPNNIMELRNKDFLKFVQDLFGEKVATFLEFLDITSAHVFLNCDDAFNIFSLESDDLLSLKKKLGIQSNDGLFTFLPGIKIKMKILKDILSKKQNELIPTAQTQYLTTDSIASDTSDASSPENDAD